MTNHERADQLLAEATEIAGEMGRTLERGRWNLSARRAQEVIEPVIKALLNEMGVEYPRIHDAAPVFTEIVRQRKIEVNPTFLDWLIGLSGKLAEVRGPAFYHEVEVNEAEARAAVEAADRVLAFGKNLLSHLRGLG